jgi:hypothetical protein
MEVRRSVVVEKHADRHAVKAADLGHGIQYLPAQMQLRNHSNARWSPRPQDAT